MLHLRRLAQGVVAIGTIAMIAPASTMRLIRGVAAGFPRVAFGTVLAGLLLLHLGARADKPQWAYQTFPFA